MRPFVSWCVALLLLTVAAAAQNQLGVEERAALDAIYGNLELAPLTLDKPLLSPAGPIRARAAFVSTATKEMALPSLSKSFNGGGHIIGFVSWFVKRVDIPVPPAKSQSPYGERSGPGVVTRIAKIVPGENTQLESFLQDGPPTYAFEHILDLKRLNLESGEYELTVLFLGVTPRTLTSTIRFQVDNPDYAKQAALLKAAEEARLKGTDQAGKAFYALLKYGKVETATEKIRLGLPFTVSCDVTYAGATPLTVPLSITSSNLDGRPMIAIANYFFMRKGDSQRFHLGNVTLNTKTPGKVMPGETFHCLVDVDADKFKLLPGSYYLILEIRGLPLSPKAFYLAYAEKKLVSLTK